MQLLPDTTLQNGKYTITGVLGQGGFGITYLARQSFLNRDVAIKEFFMNEFCERDDNGTAVTISTKSNRDLVDRCRGKFIKEAQLIASFNNPHVIRIYDIFEENRTAYYVMEYHKRGSLRELVKTSGRLSADRSVAYIRQISEALSYIHDHNVLHLDIKPSNILVDDTDSAVLIDFGVSKRYDDEGGQTSSSPVGRSRGFAPLEQYMAGGVEKFTSATDIYSLGATLYYLVTGEVPPEASDVMEDGLGPRPSYIPEKMWCAVTASMSSFRKQRPQTVSAFVSMLGSSGPAVPVVKPEPVKKPYVEDERTRFDEVIITERVSGYIGSHDYVDLGLPSGLLWATCNVGASKPSEYGSYYSWGETATKNIYNWSNLKYCNDSTGDSFSKYNRDQAGTKDNIMRLEMSDDAARANWGGSWRMPTVGEWKELKNNCTWTWTSQGGHNGYKVTGKNGNSIFLPAAGCRYGESLNYAGEYGYYWSSSLNTVNSLIAFNCYFNSGLVSPSNWYSRYLGQSVRPVSSSTPQ